MIEISRAKVVNRDFQRRALLLSVESEEGGGEEKNDARPARGKKEYYIHVTYMYARVIRIFEFAFYPPGYPYRLACGNFADVIV